MDNLLHRRRNNKRPFWVHLVLMLIVLIVLLMQVNSHNRIQTNEYVKETLEKELAGRNAKINGLMSDLQQAYASKSLASIDPLNSELEGINGILCLFHSDSLVYWSSNSVEISDIVNLKMRPIVLLNDGWYKINYKEQDGVSVFGLLLIKKEFAYRKKK